jgi:DNA-binding FadR family transcriptional regulator
MQVTTVERRSLSQSVFEQLRDRILSGEIEPGAALPSERLLCEQLGVNRAALREALKRLQQLHLVAVRQGEPTRVLDHTESGGLELLIPMLFQGGVLQGNVARSLVELRSVLGPDIARLAALHRTDEQLVQLRAARAKMQDLPRDDAVALQRAHLQIWRVLIRASHNVAYRMAFNTMERAWEGFQDAVAPALMDEVGYLTGYEQLVRAVERGWHEAARKAAAKLVERGANRMNLLIDAATGGRNA